MTLWYYSTYLLHILYYIMYIVVCTKVHEGIDSKKDSTSRSGGAGRASIGSGRGGVGDLQSSFIYICACHVSRSVRLSLYLRGKRSRIIEYRSAGT